MKEPIKPSLMRWHKPQNRQSLVLPMQRSWIMKQKTTVPKHLDSRQVLDTWNKRMEENRTSLIVSSSRNYMKQDSRNELLQAQQITTVEDEDFPTEVMVVDRDLSTGTNLEIFSQEDEVVEPLEPLQPSSIPHTVTQTRQQTNNSRSADLQTKDVTSIDTTLTTKTILTTNHTSTLYTKTVSGSRHSKNQPYTSELLDTRRWYLTRGTYNQFLRKLEKDNNSFLAFADSRAGVQAAIHIASNPMEGDTSSGKQIRPIGDGFSSTEISDSRDYRRKQRPKVLKSIPFKILHYSGANKEATNSGLQKIEPIHTSSALQDGRGASVKRANRKRRLHNKIRSKRCLYSSSHSSEFKTFPGVQKWGNHIQLPLFKLWFKHRSKNFFQTSKIRPGTITKRRYSPSLFSRRYLHLGSRKGEITGISRKDHVTSGSLGVYNKQKQECINTITGSKLLGVHLRHQEDDHKGTRKEDQELKTETQASATGDNEIVQVDGKLDGKDDSDDTSSRGSPSTHTIFTERFDKVTHGETPELGDAFCMVDTSERGNKMVADKSDDEEWFAHKTAADGAPSNYNIHRQLGHGLGNNIPSIEDSRILERGRKELVHQRKRADGHIFCLKAPCSKIQKQNNQDLHRQQNVHKVHNKGRGYCLSNPSGHCSKDSRFMQSVLPQGGISTCQRHIEYGSGQLVEEATTVVRKEFIEEHISGDTDEMGSIDSGHVCKQTQSKTSQILQPPARPRSPEVGCLTTEMAEENSLLLSTMEADSESSQTYNQPTPGESGSDNTKLADSILVPNGDESETVGTSKVLQMPETGLDRLAIIRKTRQTQGLGEEEAQFLEGCIRSNTAKAYDNGWKKWASWCNDNRVNCCEYNIENIIKFLLHHKEYSTQHLNTLRSSIASVFKYIHADKPPIASNQRIQEFFAAKRRKTFNIPSVQQLEAWDTDLLVTFIRRKWRNNETLSLEDLQQKTIGLLCLATMARPRSDLGRLQYQDVILKYGENESLLSAVLHFRQAKETQVKTITLGPIEDISVCPVRALETFLKKTTGIRISLPQDHTLFLAYIMEVSKVTSIRPSTLANWVKQLMRQAGVDPNYKAHSIRSASSTKAVARGNTIQSVKKHANWSLNTNTFESFYYKPTAANSTSTLITNSILTPENLITLGAEAEETEIVVGTTNNQDVSEAEASNVINAHPWYKFWKA
ncbi:hypothetical protein G6F35_004141 [Rhizopus arrhizus]|nr:hypothetical protein G6F35_004141 [Rhizopus arrhizus]